MRAAGLANASIAARAADGRLHRLHRGVYAVAHTALTPDARRLAAVLAGGDGARLCFRSAADLWGVLGDGRRVFDISVTGARGPGAARDPRAPPGPRRSHHHRGPRHPGDEPRPHVPRPRRGGPPRPADERAGARRGAAALRPARGRRRARPATRAGRGRGRSRPPSRASARRPSSPLQAERFALALVERHGLPHPAVNAWVHGGERDLAWPDQRRGRRDRHLRASRFADRVPSRPARDADLTAAGYRVVRFTGRQLEDEPARCAEIVKAVLAA